MAEVASRAHGSGIQIILLGGQSRRSIFVIEIRYLRRPHPCSILVGEHARVVRDGVEGRPVLRRGFVDRELVHHAVVHHDRQAEDVTRLCSVLGSQETRLCGAALGPGMAKAEGSSGTGGSAPVAKPNFKNARLVSMS